MTIILQGDCLDVLGNIPDNSVHCCVTSPPYYNLRDYGHEKQIGMEDSPSQYIARLVAVFNQVRRILRDDGTLWLNMGDSYATKKIARKEPYLKYKDLMGMPWRVAFALQDAGWYLRQDVIWNKPNAMPESTDDRCTKAHEYIFILSKLPNYYYDAESIKEPAVTVDRKKWTDNKQDKQRGHGRRHAGFNGRYAERIAAEGPPKTRNRRDVWTVATRPFRGAHFATFPPQLIEPCILAGSPVGGLVLDPFAGSGTVALVAKNNGRGSLNIEINPDYIALINQRLGAP